VSAVSSTERSRRRALIALNRTRSLRQAALLTAVLGIVHAVLFLLATFLLSSTPGATAGDAEYIAFYSSPEQRRVIIAAMYVMPFAGIAFLWFIILLRQWINLGGGRRDQLFSNVQLVSGVVFLALFLASAAADSTTAASVEFSDAPIDPAAARLMPTLGRTMLLVLAMRMAAIFVFSTTSIARTAAILPRWFIVAGYVVGIFLLLSVTFSPLLVLAFPSWVIVLCLLLIDRARRIPAGLTIDRVATGRETVGSAIRQAESQGG
jgi:hypothetical protein